MKGTTIALLVVGVAALGGLGFYVFKAHEKADAAAAAAKTVQAGPSKPSASATAGKIISMVPAAVNLGKQIASLF